MGVGVLLVCVPAVFEKSCVLLLLSRVLQNDLGSMGARVISAGKETGNRVGPRRSIDLPAEESRGLLAAGRKEAVTTGTRTCSGKAPEENPV